jgi:putative N6-adenine-specific DNA methylase
MTANRYFATCARRLEPILAQELREIGAAELYEGRGGVAFAGPRELLYKANLWLRTAVRVLQPIMETAVHSTDELYEAAGTVNWDQYLTLEHTFAIDANVRDSAITHSQYAARRVKDAICDQFVSRVSRRPSVDPKTPMVGLNLHIYRDNMVLSLDSSGESLHKRGYRPILTKAPLNEALSAAIVLMTGWNGQVPFADPMCGSGTLPIEASWIALKRPPGLTRKRFGFQGWLDYDVRLWTSLRDEARRGVAKQLAAPIAGSDLRADAVAFAKRNAHAAGVGHLLPFTRRDLSDFTPPGSPPGVIVCNPPYGERLGETNELVPLYQLLGRILRERCAGYAAFVLCGNPELESQIGLEPRRHWPLYNGRIACRLLEFVNS